MNAALSSLHPTEPPVFSGLGLILDFRPEKKAASSGRLGMVWQFKTNMNKGGNSATFSESEEL